MLEEGLVPLSLVGASFYTMISPADLSVQRQTPLVPIDRFSGEPHEAGIMLAPPKGGTRIRVLDIPPDDASLHNMTAKEARAGDIIVQCGTNHGWSNRSDANCRIAFILIDGVFEDGL